ncbi:MAG: ABC transporter ATP-binding protein/permease [Gammaproteobacteria bacterium]|nr:ABC transporter ATP-binding protein/permease [Gammaproteobacteria bacterium]MDH3847417.1 ABC transporter ATP-binding protein/permease [Gammaproteobacteria bacterium]MDH3863789.1 ABC transporter ATP-binding protein/permease [Gammaproteobacteria bacterium]MDH3953256.1 ABC transporter ATP-binding protein/permease [Gammaproteobacteria bacterium]
MRRALGVFGYTHRAINLVWTTSRPLTVALAVLTIVAGVLPAAIAWVGQLIVDGVVAAMSEPNPDAGPVLRLVGLEAFIVILLAGSQRGLSASQSLLRALLGQRVNVMILEKALTLQLTHFEDSEFYDKLTQARREASSRPLSLVNRTFGLVQNTISLTSYAVLLFAFSPWAVIILLGAGLPSFFAEAKFSGDAFRLFRWRSPDTRMQMYLETVIAREDGVKEVKLFQLGPKLLQRYRDIFNRLFVEDRRLTIRRDSWGFLLGLVSTAAFYGAYAWIILATIDNRITLGAMTMYLVLFRQGQTAVAAILSAISGMYEDNLYLSNLYEYLGQPVPARQGRTLKGPDPLRGLEFEHVSFAYPGAGENALSDINLQIRRGESVALVGENGSGKTTLIKLLTRLYEPTEGRILLEGLDLREWDVDALRQRIGVIFQDFGRYQFTVGENIGAGDVRHMEDTARQAVAAETGMAAPFIETMPEGYETQLGRWFKGGRELSGGQWQKIALSRAFMRSDADILVLDEPTAAMDAASEAAVFELFRAESHDKMTILISHRFSTVRAADQIVVIHGGRIIERGTHESLLAENGTYAHLFELQAKGYQ